MNKPQHNSLMSFIYSVIFDRPFYMTRYTIVESSEVPVEIQTSRYQHRHSYWRERKLATPTIKEIDVQMRKTASLQPHHNERDGVSNHWRLDCLLRRLCRRRSKNTSRFHVTGFCAGNPPLRKDSNAESVSIWWRYNNDECSLPIWSTHLEIVCFSYLSMQPKYELTQFAQPSPENMIYRNKNICRYSKGRDGEIPNDVLAIVPWLYVNGRHCLHNALQHVFIMYENILIFTSIRIYAKSCLQFAVLIFTDNCNYK